MENEPPKVEKKWDSPQNITNSVNITEGYKQNAFKTLNKNVRYFSYASRSSLLMKVGQSKLDTTLNGQNSKNL